MNEITARECATPIGLTRIEAVLAPKLNLADFQNSIPVIRELAVINDAATPAAALLLRLESEPPFVRPKSWRLEAVDAHGRYHIRDIDIQLDGALLARLTEAESATARFVLRHAEEDAEPLAILDKTIELLPRNHWGGLSHLPEMAAAFVQPNDPAVDRLLKQAAEILRINECNPALNGYVSGARHAWELASAVWSAVAALGLDYALPPASFELTGQKVRGPAQIDEARLATCMDLSLLFCAALEQAGLNPLLVFTKGHAFSGVWLRAEEFSSVVVDDVTALRKRIQLRELVLFETTLVTQRPAPGFSHAVEVGAQQVAEAKDADFQLAVDIRRARLQRIKPLASAEAPAPAAPAEATPAVVAPPLDEAPALIETPETDEPALAPADRLSRWQRKLLDLSLRNNLLNFRPGKRSLSLDAPDPAAIEDLLASGQGLKLLPRPNLMDGLRNEAIHEQREHEEIRRVHALEALQRRELFVGITPDELDGRLVELYRLARANLQEGGANALYLAVGFLSWTRDDRQGQRFRAPLILLPVVLSRRSVRSGFTIALHDDEPRFNPTLLEMLRQDFRLALAFAEGELPKDDSGLDIRGIWRLVAAAVKEIKGWEVTEEVVLATFSFAKHLMWKDLVDRIGQLRENPVVRHLIDTPRDPYPSSVSFPEPKRLDRELGPDQTFCPLPADSSQLSAVVAAARGKDFVLIGPPGTGKSQTIANLIAQCLADGKRVLFVSEKIAALDVVYRRLREVGLGEFCLELHSNKARKLDVLAQLGRAWEARGDADPEVWRREGARLKRLRDELNAYVGRLHLRRGNGMSLYEAIGTVLAGRDLPRPGLRWDRPDRHDADALNAMREVVDRLEVNRRAVGEAGALDGALGPVGQTEWSPSWQQRVVDAARAVLPAALRLAQRYEQFASVSGLPASALDGRARGAFAVLARILPQAAGHDWRFTLRLDAGAVTERLTRGKALLAEHRALSAGLSTPWSDTVVAECRRGLDLLRERRETLARLPRPWGPETVDELKRGLGLLGEMLVNDKQLSVRYDESVEQLNVHLLLREWNQAAKMLWPRSALRRRKIRRQLEAVVGGEGVQDAANDLPLLAANRTLRAEVTGIEIGTATDGLWTGMKTRPELVQAALELQEALAAAHRGEPWADAGFEAIAEGRCGERLGAALAGLRTLTRLDRELQGLGALGEATGGLWAGAQTAEGALAAAVEFVVALRAVRESGALPGAHALVAQGGCGTALAGDFDRLSRRFAVEEALRELDDLRERTAGVWQGVKTRAEEVDAALQFHAEISSALANCARTPEEVSLIKGPLERLLGEGNALLAPNGPIAEAGARYLEAARELPPLIDELTAIGHFDEPSRLGFQGVPLEALRARCEAMIQAEHRLRTWCAWRKVRDEAAALGLGPLVEGIEAGVIAPGTVRRIFETDYCRWWLDAVVEEEPLIRGFVSAEHEKRIDDFRAVDDLFVDLTRAYVRARLCGETPARDQVARSSEWGLLQRELSKKKRHLPLRELMTGIPAVLARLTPCLLMSPLSIAQYLPADAAAFDLVVFDEASQIPVWDAVGAIARGRQVVMVGDPKQLPPTSFFDRAESEWDEEDVEPDLESILDECLGANLPAMHLSWHYRSRNESLISFSNHHYYGGALITFPSPATEDTAVSFHHVAGVYEKGGARINKPEAKALVADLVARLKTPGFSGSGQTLGVVTFNSEQQALIENLLDDERRKDPSLEPHFAEAGLESVFVKNLESVQGDERDIIYFSITYGPDIGGGISMNFGPMNRDGGERRLNVAITRARRELRVFSSLRAEQFDLSRTQAPGVRDLKHFLEFAERGPRALAESVSGSLGGFESPFEASVADALAGKGWRIHTQIGASVLRIDLGVVHPDAPGRYLTGIECDGATYHRSATARDRDKLREQVLRGLGWEILRVWSTDWWIDPEGSLEKLDAGLRRLLEQSRTARALEAEREAQARAAAQRAQSSASQAPPAQPSAEPAPAIEPDPAVPPPADGDGGETSAGAPVGEEAYARAAAPASEHAPGDFVTADPSAAAQAVAPEAFFEAAYEPALARMIAQVVETEGPVLDAVLARRIARAHGWQRTGARIRERVERLARRAHPTTREAVGVFYWPAHYTPGAPVPFRRSAERTNVDEICMQELVTLAGTLLDGHTDGEAVIVAMARELGLHSVRPASRGRIEEAVRRAAKG